MPLNKTACPKCGTRVHIMAGVNVLEQFKRHCFLVCWKCKLVASTKPERTWINIKDAKKMELQHGDAQ